MKKLLFLSLLLISNIAFSQSRMITGTVVDGSQNAPIPGVSVKVKGITKGTITDLGGNFSLLLEPSETELVFTFIGYKDKTVYIGTQTSVNVRLDEDVEQLDEVVVVGYQVQKKSVVTGAIASVKSEDITQVPVQNAAQSLQGKTPGVLVTPVSGQPGAGIDIRVRGTGSNGDNTPLYVVDGIQIDNINFLNPSDIESIEVLKDAASSAIYGSRGANGVVLVTTKKGKEGVTSVSYDGYYGVQEAWRNVPVMNAQQYMAFHNEGAENGGALMPFTENDILNNTVDTDWQGEIFEPAPIQSHNLQFSGGTGKSSFMTSIGYFGQQGIVAPEKSKFERFTVRLNASHKLSEYFKMGTNMSFVREESQGINENNQFGSVLQNALLHDPLTPVLESDPAKIEEYENMDILPVKNSNGDFYGISDRSLREIVNPLARIENTYGNNKNNKFIGNMFLELTPGIEGLSIKTDLGVDVGNWYGRSYSPEAFFNNVTYADVSRVNQNHGTYTTLQWENVISYAKKINDHKLSILVGNTVRTWESEDNNAARTGLQINGWEYAWVNNGTADRTQGTSGGMAKHGLVSYFGKASYDYKEKYLLSVIARYDGSSRFGADNKFGFFPSVQAGWILSQENFLMYNETVNFLKLRASWGRVGNERIGDFGYLELFDQTPWYSYGSSENQSLNPGFGITRMPNPGLKWETAEEINLGIDAGFFNDHITASLDLYSRERKDLLGTKPVPAFTGVGGPIFNLGTVSNKGVEVALTYSKRSGELTFDITGNFAYNDNKMVEVANEDGRFSGPSMHSGEGQLMIQEGHAMPFYFGWKTDGILQNQAEADAYNEQFNKDNNDKAVPGDIRFVDLNGDNVIDNDDRTDIGSPVHSWMYGLNIRMEYKGFDFAMFWQGQAGGKLINGNQRIDLTKSQNYPTRYLDRWTGENSTNSFPIFSYEDNNRNFIRLNDMVHVEDASYLRLRNIQLGYTLPQHITTAIGMNKLRVYASANNLLTFTQYSGMDPEVGHGGIWTGYDYGSYPQAKSYLLGLNISF
ncbi:SusC/RagA family TonB-linked outer membrane protein [Flammeovirga aprica]|uniref:TonB-dependent receptor n=1 Tax=Flammeovirga aprica JL-4 TaxID=694437 RepID=A0A7X9P225_9BACT|nr:TonB-dependent receptor [Flammeovirga aprica]NME68121.1 TonB-dependent receptor [Flammeovirga aprica JL-4]